MDLWIYLLIGCGSLIISFLILTGKIRLEEVKIGEYSSETGVGEKTLFISFGDFGIGEVSKIKTINSENGKELIITLVDGEPLIGDLVLNETVWLLNEVAFAAGDPYRKAIIHIPRESPVREILGVKPSPFALTKALMENRAYRNMIDNMITNYDKIIRQRAALIKELRQAGGQGLPPYMLPGGSKYRYGQGSEEE